MRQKFVYKTNIEVPEDSPLSQLKKGKRASIILELAEKAFISDLFNEEDIREFTESAPAKEKPTKIPPIQNEIQGERLAFLEIQRKKFNL